MRRLAGRYSHNACLSGHSTVGVPKRQREAIGLEDEEFAWSHVLVNSWKNGQLAFICEFDADDLDPAFAYAEGAIAGSL